jgi:hypothetical protein
MRDDAPSFPFFLPAAGVTDTCEPIIVPTRSRVALKACPRGHGTKITAALKALVSAGQLPEFLRQCEIIDRCDAWLEREGCKAHERPSRSSYVRFFKRSK